MKIIITTLTMIFISFGVNADEKSKYKLIIEKLNSIENRIKDIEKKI